MSYFPKETIVVPVDFSAASEKALEVGVELVGDRSGLHLIHVIRPYYPLDYDAVVGTLDYDAFARSVEERLERLVATLELGGAHIHTPIGEPGHEIVGLAEEVGAGLIVMPSHGRTGVKRVVLGSVAERVVRRAHCPVLVLREHGG